MPLPGLNYGRALASAAGAAQNQRGALATLIGVWGGGRDYRTSGGGTDYRVAAAQRAEAERQQYEQEQADRAATDERNFEQQKELLAMRGGPEAGGGWEPQSKQDVLDVIAARQAASGYKPQSMEEALTLKQAPRLPGETPEQEAARKGMVAGSVEAAKQPHVLERLEKAGQIREDYRGTPEQEAARKGAIAKAQAGARFPFQRQAIEASGAQRREGKMHATVLDMMRDQPKMNAAAARQRRALEASAARQKEGERIGDERQDKAITAQKDAAKIKGETDKAKAEARSREVAVEKRRKIEDAAVKAGQARAKTEMSMAIALASMNPNLPKSKATLEKFNALAKQYTDEARTTGLDNFAVSEVKRFTLDEVREQTLELTRAFSSGQAGSMTPEQYARLMRALGERQKELE